ncbi:MAG TPA: NADH:flavin oxidoreductase [Alphaproteobacteria bacterium]|jgi:2,4-dienoyl-CoA reductase-like NADH-dependent reductase (Old Yellow Enzyme family)/thioredoxin reductase|nr:NADH:flavin oxidoreductase [Pelagibacteraceae bacterium]MDP6784607.1 NADH:flavin oxidoreductase [Alphaproteobacteria bacterium]HJL58382.1 NADH:flavin oxidoreductase [Alphaproteobacteria bacterium]HJO13234.1 NADH:flavin oxidoreductase [Alphaproteobacteria bacterium]|tara:strand:- start:719 stop:2758 length:2040 start_codon:yes stop_codon:yes gene_type:complete
MKNDPILQPYKLKHLELKNRLMTSAHEPSYSEEGMPKDRYRLYHVERAKGGVALTMTAGSAVVSPDSPPAYNNLHAYKDEIIPWLRKLTTECHDYGTKVMIQITHLGRRTNWNHSDWLPVLSSSPIREPAHRSFPKEAEDWDIERIIEDYADAAERMKESGMDGVEIEAYGHLLDSFWSPATNKREDSYGGNLENRISFSIKVINAIRKKIGSEFIVGMRLVADEDWDIGLSKEEGLEIAKKIIETNKIDFLNVIRGHIDTDSALTKVIPIQGMASAPHLDFAGEIKEVTKFPVFHASKINDVATARHAISTGKLDMVGMTRAHIADPHIVNKIIEGREDRIRPCVGATYCLDRIYEGNETLCIHNPATGREAYMPHEITERTKEKKKIIVVGAGPAGLEAARVCSARGHDVVVYEALDSPGGQINLLSRSKRRKDMIGIIEWRLAECEKFNVKINYNVLADKEMILSQNPDVIIIATGGVPNLNNIQEGSDLAISTWDIISGNANIEEEVVIYDDNGSYPGLQAAEIIANHGSKLEIVTPERFFSPEIGGMNYVPYAKTFIEKMVKISINKRIQKINRRGNKLLVTLGSDYSDNQEKLETSQVIIEHGTMPLDQLYFDLKSDSYNLGSIDYNSIIKNIFTELKKNNQGSYFLYRVGDAISSRNIHAAIYDSLRICINI